MHSNELKIRNRKSIRLNANKKQRDGRIGSSVSEYVIDFTLVVCDAA